MTPAEQAREYAAANGFDLEWDGSRVLIYRHGERVGDRAKYDSALKLMQNVAGSRTKDSESYANLSLPAPRVVTVNYPKGSKMARNVTNIIDSVNDPVKFAQRIARNKPWVIFTCSDDSTDWYPLDRFGSYTDAVTEIRRCIGQDSRNGFKPTGGYVVAYVPY